MAAAPKKKVPPGLAAYQAKKGGTSASSKGRGEIPDTPANRPAIVDRIENKLGPVGKGHHESHRRNHLMDWLAQKDKKKS